MAPGLKFAEELDELITKYLDLEYSKIDICDDVEEAFRVLDAEIDQEELEIRKN